MRAATKQLPTCLAFRVGALLGLTLAGSCSPPASTPPASTPTASTPSVQTDTEAPAAEEATAATTPAPVPQHTVAASAPRTAPAIATLLQDGFESKYLERAKVFVDATARARFEEKLSDAPLAPAPAEREVDVLTVIERRAAPEKPEVRVVADTRSVRVALWMDSAQLATVVTRKSGFATSAKSAASARDPVGRPGLRVKIEQATPAKAKVTASYEFASPDSGTITLRGWLDQGAVGYVYEPALADAGAVSTGTAQFIDTAVDIAARAGGPPIAHAGPGGGGLFFPVQVLARAGGFAEVLLSAPEVELRGFVPQSALEPLVPETARGWGRGRFKAKLWQRWPKEQVRVPAGSCIYDAPDGDVIGIVKRSHVDNVVVLGGSPDQRAYRLPYDAVGYLFAADLAPARDGAGDAEDNAVGTVDPASWQCPKR